MDKRERLLRDALEALKDIVNSAGNGQPFTAEEITQEGDSPGFVSILNRAAELGIELEGEQFVDEHDYRVTWAIDLQATGPEDAAKQAWAMLDDATRNNAGASVLAIQDKDVVVHLDMETDPPRIVSISEF